MEEARGYVDSYISTYFNQDVPSKPWPVGEREELEKFYGIFYYDAVFGNDLVTRIAMTSLFRYVRDAFKNKKAF